MRNFQDLLNRFTKGEFNYERMGDMPEVRKRTNTILNDPRQMLLNTDANYSNMGSYVPLPTPQEPKQPDFRVPSQPALDADGKPMEGTSMGVPTFGGTIPGAMVGNMQGILTGYPQPQTNTMFGPVTPGAFAGKQLYPLLIPRR